MTTGDRRDRTFAPQPEHLPPENNRRGHLPGYSALCRGACIVMSVPVSL